MDKFEYIEVMRVVSSEGGKINVTSRPEVLETKRIKSFRKWIKGKNDELIKGDITMIMLESREGSLHNVLIEENYYSFIDRFNQKVPVNRITTS